MSDYYDYSTEEGRTKIPLKIHFDGDDEADFILTVLFSFGYVFSKDYRINNLKELKSSRCYYKNVDDSSFFDSWVFITTNYDECKKVIGMMKKYSSKNYYTIPTTLDAFLWDYFDGIQKSVSQEQLDCINNSESVDSLLVEGRVPPDAKVNLFTYHNLF